MKRAIQLPRIAKQFIFIINDVFLSFCCVELAFYLRLGEWQVYNSAILIVGLISVVISTPIFILLGMYRQIFRYSGINSAPMILRAIAYYSAIFVPVIFISKLDAVPRTIGLLQPMLLLFFIALSRWIAGYYLSAAAAKKRSAVSSVLVYGAGLSGRHMVDLINTSSNMHVVGYIDDDQSLQGRMINGLPVFGSEFIQEQINFLNVTSVLLAMPNISRSKRKKIIDKFVGLNVGIKTLPSISEVTSAKMDLSDIRELDYDDLLGRDPVAANPILLEKNIKNSVVLVTGAGGSIGSELSRQMIHLKPKKLLLFEVNEFSLYTLVEELKLVNFGVEIIPILGSILDENKVHEILETWMPTSIFHAAAYKHVSLVEANPAEGIKNNVFGTLCLVASAKKYKVKNFVLISTDKAVRPTNVMGASKRLAELILQAFAFDAVHTTYSMVRFGNVLGSSGSVVPKFRQQIKDGGPVTVTSPNITRYFMTIPEAAQLVIQASSLAEGGDVFLLDMGEPVKIYELAKRMIDLSGFTVRDEYHPNGDIEIIFEGMKTGEKLYEELLIDAKAVTTLHPRILRGHEEFIDYDVLKLLLDALWSEVVANNIFEIRDILVKVVSGYSAANEIIDIKYIEKNAKARMH